MVGTGNITTPPPEPVRLEITDIKNHGKNTVVSSVLEKKRDKLESKKVKKFA